MGAVAARFPTVADLQMKLQQAAVNMTVGGFLTMTVGFAVAFGLVVMVITRNPIFAVLFAFFGAWLPYLWLKRRRARRLEAFEAGLPEAIDLLGRAIRAGHHSRPDSRWSRTRPESRSPASSSGPSRSIASAFRSMMWFRTSPTGWTSSTSNPRHGDPDSARSRRQSGRGPRQPRVGHPGALHDPPPAARLRHRAASGYVLAALPIVVGAIIYLLNPEYGGLMFSRAMGPIFLGLYW